MWRRLVVLFFILLLILPLSVKTQAQCMDADQDRICDNVDPCPNDRSNSCDDDSDSDGVLDSVDQCPNERGVTSNNGCPAPDRDGDGTEDSQDRCPDTGGPSWNGGCPEGENTQPGTSTGGDGDGDGVPDGQDQCPNQPGLASHNGCLPPLPEDGDCVAATNSNQRVNIRQFPLLTATIVGQLDPTELILILEKIDTPDSPFYLSENGWISAQVLRFGGDCAEVENPQPEEACEEGTSSDTCLPAVQIEADSDCETGEAAILSGNDGLVELYGGDGTLLSSFMPFGTLTLPVNTALGDVNGDGTADIIVGTSAGVSGHVKVFDGQTGELLYSFFPYSGFTGGVNVAAGDVNGDGRADIVTGAGSGAPHVKVFSGATGELLQSFFAFPGFTGGVRVAVGDVNGDGRADIITSAASGTPHVKVFDGATGAVLQSFFAFDPASGLGANVATGDVNGDCIPDIVVGASATISHVKVFDGATMELLASFIAFPGFTGGVRVAVGDVNDNGRGDIITTAQTTGFSHIKVFDGLSLSLLVSFIP